METFKTDISVELPKKPADTLTNSEIAKINQNVWSEIRTILTMVTNK